MRYYSVASHVRDVMIDDNYLMYNHKLIVRIVEKNPKASIEFQRQTH